jgi:uncharacterized protein YecT (DUF1311 family)
MKTASLTFTTILLALPSGVAAQYWNPAQEKRTSQTYNACMDATRGELPPMFACSDAEYEIQNAKLNQAYRMVMKRLPQARRTILRASQRSWIRTRDAACQRAWDDAGGGQVSELERKSCMLRQTIARTVWLERYR